MQFRDTIYKSFLVDCEKWNEQSIGALQGLDKPKDSTGYLCFSAYYDCPNPYEIIFVYKGGVSKRKELGYDGLEKLFPSGCQNYYRDFDCFCFEINMRDPQKQEDIHATKYTFPAAVKIYKRVMNDKWTLTQKLNIQSYTEYRYIQFKTIYGIP